ncbi:hypothetical protein TRVA0_044S00430 [Trichomonascus vanleenenianus]|uniref:NAD(P)-dependent oxidoreductase n=1 Tax=Trichomonascus vanleenenianus TaxID=2268995 RepID=UPI003EC95FE2
MQAVDQIGFAGLGTMGLEMALNLQTYLSSKKLPSLLYYNRTIEKGKPIQEIGGKPTTIAELSRKCTIIFLMLSNDKAVETVVKQLIDSGISGKLVVNCSTIHPNTANAMAELVEQAGADYITSPVFGAQPIAKAAGLVFLEAGKAGQVDRITPYANAMGKKIMRFGESHSNALSMKITGNSFIMGMIELIAETQNLGESLGISLASLSDWAAGIGYTVGFYFDKARDGAYVPANGQAPAFSVENAIKDVTHGISLAEKSNVPVAVLREMQKNLKEVLETKGNLDVASVYGLLREKTGKDFENDAVKNNK